MIAGDPADRVHARAATPGGSLPSMDDAEVISRIGALVDEEHALEREAGQHGPESDAASRLREVEVALDQCWDLLRQRRARRQMGQDPDDARVRPPEVVERYQQ